MTYDSATPEPGSATSAPPAPEPVQAPLVIRLFANPATFKAALAWEGFTTRPRAKHLTLHYFDTQTASLARHNIALHLRSQAKRHILTFEAEDGAIEVLLPSPEPDLEKLGPDTGARLAAITHAPLGPAFTAALRRTLHTIQTPTASILATFDSGTIQAGATTQPIRDVTLTLKSGDQAELYRVALDLTSVLPLQLGVQTLSQRGTQLASFTPPAAVKSDARLTGAPSIDAAISAFLASAITQFTGNFPAFESGNAERAIHQMRVAMRRLRAIIGIFQRAFPNPEFLAIRNQAKAIAALLGEARNWDVFIPLITNGPLKIFPAEPGFAPIMEAAQARRAAGHAAVRALLESPETARFVLGLQYFTARNAWRSTLASTALPRLAEPAAGFAAANLARLHRKLTKHGKNLAALSPHHRHEARKALKKLRYTADLFGNLLEGRGQLAGYIRTAAALQEALGVYNDTVTALDLAARLHTGGDPAASRAVGIILGWCGRDVATEDGALRETWKKFRKTKLFK